MDLKTKLALIGKIETALHNYSTWYIDWEELYNNKGYRPEMPKDIIEADAALKEIAKVLACVGTTDPTRSSLRPADGLR